MHCFHGGMPLRTFRSVAPLHWGHGLIMFSLETLTLIDSSAILSIRGIHWIPALPRGLTSQEGAKLIHLPNLGSNPTTRRYELDECHQFSILTDSSPTHQHLLDSQDTCLELGRVSTPWGQSSRSCKYPQTHRYS